MSYPVSYTLSLPSCRTAADHVYTISPSRKQCTNSAARARHLCINRAPERALNFALKLLVILEQTVHLSLDHIHRALTVHKVHEIGESAFLAAA